MAVDNQPDAAVADLKNGQQLDVTPTTAKETVQLRADYAHLAATREQVAKRRRLLPPRLKKVVALAPADSPAADAQLAATPPTKRRRLLSPRPKKASRLSKRGPLFPEDAPASRISCPAGLDRFKIDFAYDQVLIEIVRAIPDRRFDGSTKCWYVNTTLSSLPGLRTLIEQHHFEVDEDAKARLAQLATQPCSAGETPLTPLSSSQRGDLNLCDGKIAVRFNYDPKLVELLKQIGGGRWHPATKSWLFATTAARQLIASLPDFDISPAIIESINQQRQAVAASQAANTELQVAGLGGELRPFQRAGVAYALWARQCFIADEPGLGKTIQALATIHIAQAFPALVVCPASLKLNWQQETLRWLPGRQVTILQGTSPQDLTGELLIANYEILSAHQQALQALGLQAIVLDESHFCKNPRARRMLAAEQVAQNVPLRLCLTGTPILNRPVELVSQLRILGRLDDLGGFYHFSHHYCNAHETEYGWDFSGAAHLEELNEKLRATCYIRRKKADVLSELPAKQRASIPVEISNRREYQRAEADLIAWLRAHAAEDAAFIASIKHLPAQQQLQCKQTRADSAEERARRALQLVRIEALKQLAARGKLAAVQEWIATFLETGEKLVVFAYHNEIVAQLAQQFNVPSISGATAMAERQANVERFQADAQTRLIVLNLQTGGVGITLTAASNVAFVELGWTPAIMDQATDRTHRIGQQQQVTAWYLLAAQTIDESIDALIERKRVVVNAITDGNRHTQDISILNELIGELLQKPG